MIMGVDIGLSGSVAVLDDHGHFAEVFDLPIMQAGGKQSYVKNVIASAVLADMLHERMAGGVPPVCYVETVNAMPSQGVSSVFSLGSSFGSVTAVLGALHLPYVLIRPQEWKKHFGLHKAEKGQSIAKAMQLVPDAAPYLKMKKDHNRAESVLIAIYGFMCCSKTAT